MPRAPVLLALDTATTRCSVALALGDEVHVDVRDAGQRHTEYLLPMVDALLARHGVALQGCDAIAFGAGPGSFTGLRVACGVAQGLAYGCDRPVVAVGNLDAAAADAFARLPAVDIVCVALDARMREVYCGVFARAGAGIRMLASPAVAAPADVAGLARRHGADALVGHALTVYRDDMTGFDGTVVAELEADAGSIARLALLQFARGGAVEPAAAAPLYVRDRIALTIDERRQGAVLAGQGGAS